MTPDRSTSPRWIRVCFAMLAMFAAGAARAEPWQLTPDPEPAAAKAKSQQEALEKKSGFLKERLRDLSFRFPDVKPQP